MSDIRLPQRPRVELPPPVEGLADVRREAGRRRRRKTAAVAGGGVGAVAIAVAVAMSGNAGGFAVLKPAPPAGPGVVEPTPTPSGRVAVTVGTTERHGGTGRGRLPVAGRKAGRPSTAGSGHGVARVPNAADVPPPAVPRSPQQPQLVRTQSTYDGSPRECTGSTYGDGNGGLENSVGWCLGAVATPVSGGVRLRLELCRDSTGGGTLSFGSTREVDLEVRQGNHTVWDWAELHPGGPGRHQLTAGTNGCWSWTVVWPDARQDGQSAGRGSFTFVGTSTADEMKGKPAESTGFSY